MQMLLENQLAALVTLISDEMETAYGDLSPRAASALLTLINRGRIEISTLAAIIGTTQPTATRLIDGLEKSGLVSRGPKEGRTVALTLTESGMVRAQELAEARASVMGRLLEALSDEERAPLFSLVGKLIFAGTQDREHARTTCRYCDHGVCVRDICPISQKATAVEIQDSGGAMQ